MSAPTRAPAEGQRRRVGRRPLGIGLAVFAALVVLSVLTRDDADLGGRLDPRNPDRDGGQALARVLEDLGVDVEIARGQEELLDQEVGPGTSVVLTNPEQLGDSTLESLRRHAGPAGSVVVVGDAAVIGSQLDASSGDSLSGEQRAGCDLRLAQGVVLRTYGEPGLAGAGCFGSGGTSALVNRDRWWLLASPLSLTNEHVLDADNAALALRLLGQQDRVVWYVADLADTTVSDQVLLSALLPDFLVPALWLLAAATLALVLWRGRRLGPLVTEPLPVVVRAAESTRSRGQVYHRTRDRRHAAVVLCEATRRRLAVALRLPPGAGLPTLVAAVADRSGRDPGAVAALLSPPLIGKDSQLVELGQQLTRLENEVRAP